MANNDISVDDVKDLVYSYEDKGVTDELYSFGVMLLNEVGQRSSQIEAKASTTLGWATGIIAFLFGTLGQAPSVSILVVTFLGAMCALTAIVLSFAALRVRDAWKWPSDRDWFEKTALVGADELKRFHIRSLHQVRQAQKHTVDRKADYVFWGQRSLVLGGILMAIGIALKLLFVFYPVLVVFLKRIGMSIGLT